MTGVQTCALPILTKEICAKPINIQKIKTEDKNPVKRSEDIRVVPKKVVVESVPVRMSREELFWQKYDQRNKKGIFIKLKEKINKYCGSY